MGFFAKGDWEAKLKVVESDIPKCGACGLFRKCQSPKMKPSGEGARSILFIGEAPGREEDAQGTQFVGPAGQLLRSLCREVGLDLDECWKENAIRCRPPGNEIEELHVESCRPNVMDTIRRLKPKVVVLLGLSAVQSVIGAEWGGSVGTMARWAGWEIPSAKYGCWIVPTYHPSFVLRTEKDQVLPLIVKGHLRRAMALEGIKPHPLDLNALKREVDVIMRPRLAMLRMRDLSRKRGVLSFDYETTGLKPEPPKQRIVCTSFCMDGEGTFACFTPPDTYPTLSKILRNDRLLKVASNLKYEERWTRRKLGHPVAGWHWDTMLNAHVADNRSNVTSVKFQAYVHFGIGDYNVHVKEDLKADEPGEINNIDNIHPNDLLSYCSLDSLIEHKVMETQQRILP